MEVGQATSEQHQQYNGQTLTVGVGETSPLLIPVGNGNNVNDDGTQTIITTTPTSSSTMVLMTGRLLLFVVAFLYGTLNVCLRFVYELQDPPSASALSTTRGWLAVLCFIPLIVTNNHRTRSMRSSQQRQQKLQQQQGVRMDGVTTNRNNNDSIWWIGLELAIWNFGAQGLLNLGLLSIASSARASFLTQTSVVMTPVVSAIAGHQVKSTVWIGCIAALCGLLLMSGDDKGGIGDDISLGDVIVLLGALCWSLYIFRLSCVGDRYDEIQLQAIKTYLLAWLYTGWFLIAAYYSEASLWSGWNKSLIAWIYIFYSALGPGTIADIIQQKAQVVIAASEANIVLSMEPVFTAILGRIILHEITSWQEKLGGTLIICAALIATR